MSYRTAQLPYKSRFRVKAKEEAQVREIKGIKAERVSREREFLEGRAVAQGN